MTMKAGRIPKPRTSPPSRSCSKSPKACEGQVLDAVQGAATATDCLPSGTFPGRSPKRRLGTSETDAELDTNAPPTKRARLAHLRQDSCLHDILPRPVLQQPWAKPAKAPFLKDFVDPVQPIPAHGSVQAFISQWLASVEDQTHRCRSDSYLYRSASPVPRQLARSALEMSPTQDTHGCVVPQTPASTTCRPSQAGAVETRSASYTGSVASTPTSGRSAALSLVEEPLYRVANLASNRIHFRHAYDPFPDHVTDLVNHLGRKRDSPGPTLEDVRQNKKLSDFAMDGAEPDVEEYFNTCLFPNPDASDALKRSVRQPMAKHTVPSTGSKHKVSTPVPDVLYGYNRSIAFAEEQQGQLLSLDNEMVANNQDLLYPFFVIEFKGDGPSSAGSLWVATNQCLGGSASCVNVAERLNRQLSKCQSEQVCPITSTSFSIAMSGTEARLFVSWQSTDLNYYMQQVESFVLQRPEHYLEFRKYVRNIIDWGKDRRLKEIRDSLDVLLEESRKRVAEVKNRPAPAPSDSSSGSGSRKRRPPSSRLGHSTSTGAESRRE